MPYETSGPVNFRFKGCRVVFYMFIHILKEYFVSNSGDPDRTPLSVAVSDLDLHCSYFSHKRHWSYMAYTFDLNSCTIIKVGFLDSAKHLLISSYRDNIEK